MINSMGFYILGSSSILLPKFLDGNEQEDIIWRDLVLRKNLNMIDSN